MIKILKLACLVEVMSSLMKNHLVLLVIQLMNHYAKNNLYNALIVIKNV